MADLAVVEELCRETLTDGGKYHVFQSTRKVRVIGRPEQVEAIRQMLPHLSQVANVKIEFLAETMSEDGLRGVQVGVGGRGRVGNVEISGGIPGSPGVIRRSGGGGVSVWKPGGGAIDIDVINQSTGGAGMSKLSILVQSGKEGFIEVAREVPMIDYFTRYVVDGRYGAVLGVTPWVAGNPHLLTLAGAAFEVPQIRWEKEGTRMLVRPVVEGDLIHLTLMPQISAIRIVDPAVFRSRGLNTFLTGREQYVTYTQLATSVTVQSGQELTIGGFENAEPEFNRFFFGGTASTQSSRGSFRVRATVQ
jgi:hypothetical protein